MRTPFIVLIALCAACLTTAAPAAQPWADYVPGQTPLYNSYTGKAAPFPGGLTGAILPTSSGAPAADDLLFQNLLAAEWIVFSLYQQGVEAFNVSSFTSLGYPNTTYDRITEIRDNEAGHLNIFYDEISNASIKPGPCKYDFYFTGPEEWLAVQVLVELTSMAFLTGFVQEAQTNSTRAALLAIAQTESRHNTWALIDIWNTDPFAGPADTISPYANQVLKLAGGFVVNGSCPTENPPFPDPGQHLPSMSFNGTGAVGTEIDIIFPTSQPTFKNGTDYYMVYFHGLLNVSLPYDPVMHTSIVPNFDAGKGLVVAVIADAEGAPTMESVVAGPLMLIEQPAVLTQSLAPFE
ncbi:hypothetical protein BAUCODRAFT_133780 [Baudoinia panamericana UAMH 10762]|uniref:Iminophenyl-pyruvate dimer synthase domain-containing protein n=1 Tax=Baudoinia panamericana (strain UAMH 10762) TaxID=717646 RepID=M2N2G4_BAUPA|nr:uncharacterized protein BAUCODRAFT_133780 [Baudoinia panamericana UAMH 10762]EMC92860.1 hypothetical protein BAUCODRAFT_133780 [Baudoinia panamericana UAMH 10762]